MFPKYKIETYTGGTLDHTITEDCQYLRFKNVLSGMPGQFSFTLSGRQGLSKVYADIAAMDKVKIYLGNETLPTNPNYVGRIENVISQRKDKVFNRVFSGRDLGEVLLRRLKPQFNTNNGTAHTMVDHWADDLGLAKDTDDDSTTVNILSTQSRYQDLIKEIGDYGATISKDFYVYDNAGTATLAWKTRPIRTIANTPPVSTFTMGENFNSYVLTKNVQEILNNFHVFGASEPPIKGTSVCSHSQYEKSATDYPTDHDNWTETDPTTTGWTVTSKSGNGYAVLQAIHHHVGNCDVMFHVDQNKTLINEWIQASFTFPIPITVKDHSTLNFCLAHNEFSGSVQLCQIGLLAPDGTHHFGFNFSSALKAQISNYDAGMTHFSIPLGAAYETVYGATDAWQRVEYGADWYDLETIEFYMSWNNPANDYVSMHLDGLYFSDLRWHSHVTDPGSIGSYEQRDVVVIDDKIHSNAEAASYAAYLKARYKDLPSQLDLLVPLDLNLLIGDRIPVTIPDENLSAVNFDLIGVEQILDPNAPEAYSVVTLTNAPLTRDNLGCTDIKTYFRKLRERSLQQADGKVTS